MKKILPCFLILFLLAAKLSMYAQEDPNALKLNIEKYRTDTVRSDFATVFSTSDDKINFKKLRCYLQNKQKLHDLIHAELGMYADVKRNLEQMTQNKLQVDQAIEIAKKDPDKMAAVDIYLPNCSINFYGSSRQSIDDLKNIRKLVEDCAKKEEERKKEYDILKMNLSSIQEDLTYCQDQLDSTLAPEYQNQEFRKQISIGFAFLLGFLLLVFILVIYRSDKNVADYFFSDTGLQFITIFVLIIAIILFGILGVLEGKELSAILAGISGYILGKTKSPNPNPAPANNPASNPNGGSGNTGGSTNTNGNTGNNSTPNTNKTTTDSDEPPVE